MVTPGTDALRPGKPSPPAARTTVDDGWDIDDRRRHMRRMQRFTGLMAGAFALALVAAACSSSSSAGTGGGVATTGGGAAPSGTTVTQSNFVFTPSTLTVAAGTTVTVTNSEASTSHTFTIDGQGINITNSGGQSQDVTLNLKPGTYTFYCQFHVSQGMKGTVTIT
jgi:plastocyanin